MKIDKELLEQATRIAVERWKTEISEDNLTETLYFNESVKAGIEHGMSELKPTFEDLFVTLGTQFEMGFMVGMIYRELEESPLN